MKKNYVFLTLALLTCAAAPQKALADEVWTTEEYNVVYQEDRNKTAVWRYGSDGVIFIDGLAGVFTDRGSYSGYWVQNSSSVRCDTYREGADGKPTYHWGRVEITFIDPDFPSRWQADISICDGLRPAGGDRNPVMTLNGTPVTK
ncbi:hypothetical protein PN465_04260 [Nodularia spumigena CS-584]|jgi:hypothetical protein|uniref:Uncharacterized protein n=1 Tax=Nodularia spumigena UHCC 0060 TaxID=3110300 RepID=A0ABU5UKL1_NODSP|nr:hypothetical protein [Nodularia spumigena]AHJ27166.1 hypothetical protein NSP_8180 [Nodularia spumigena CCY9414]EAW46005.1 hypothetical protein N9414_14117 [Nodularia spumigena CCY9414]MDB9381453.1 hypothetical protein [Nodularia spumigena CS-584]MEA5524880.1 hypothetical protein [Nodularia spumigena UHCC 0143]MEA5557409.1 hypothetical protein [Nodularia spumigena CH309]